MKVVLESTPRIVTIDGTEARVWAGITGDGVACVAFITRVVVRADQDTSELDRELLHREPKSDVTAAARAVHEILG